MLLFRKAVNVDQAGDHGHGDPAPSLTDGLSTSLIEVVLFKRRCAPSLCFGWQSRRDASTSTNNAFTKATYVCRITILMNLIAYKTVRIIISLSGDHISLIIEIRHYLNIPLAMMACPTL